MGAFRQLCNNAIQAFIPVCPIILGIAQDTDALNQMEHQVMFGSKVASRTDKHCHVPSVTAHQCFLLCSRHISTCIMNDSIHILSRFTCNEQESECHGIKCSQRHTDFFFFQAIQQWNPIVVASRSPWKSSVDYPLFPAFLKWGSTTETIDSTTRGRQHAWRDSAKKGSLRMRNNCSCWQSSVFKQGNDTS